MSPLRVLKSLGNSGGFRRRGLELSSEVELLNGFIDVVFGASDDATR